jgi:hypothetical protein
MRSGNFVRKFAMKGSHVDGEVMTRLEVILRDWAGSKDAQKQIALVQYGYGKPVDKIETTGLENKTTVVVHYGNERPDLFARSRGTINAVNGEGTRRPLLPDANLAGRSINWTG